MSAEENKASVQRWVDEAWNQGRFESAGRLYPAEYTMHNPGPDIQGAEGLCGFITMYRAGMPDLHMTVEDMLADGDKVVWRVRTRGTQTGPLFGIPPTGRSAEVGTTIISRFANGQWVEDWVQNDDLGLLQQLGAVPMPQAAAAS
jgi:predicted ester cyclase